MKWLLALLLISFAGCTSESLDSFEPYEFPLIGNGTTLRYEIENFEDGTKVSTQYQTEEFLFNEAQFEGRTYYLTFETFGNQTDPSWANPLAIDVETRGSGWFNPQIHPPCIGCQLEAVIEDVQVDEGFPVPLEKGDEWSRGTSRTTVDGKTTISSIGGARETIQLTQTFSDEEGTGTIKDWIDVETGISLKREGKMAGYRGTMTLVEWNLVDESRNLEEALDRLWELWDVQPSNQSPILTIYPTMDLDNDPVMQMRAMGELNFQVFLEGVQVYEGPVGSNFTVTAPGIYEVEGVSPAGHVVSGQVTVSGTILLSGACAAGVALTEPCSTHSFYVPNGTSSLKATAYGSAGQNQLEISDGAQTYTATGGETIELTRSHDGTSGHWSATYTPTVSSGASDDIRIRVQL